MPKPVTNAEFVRSASYLAKNAAAWAGDTALMMVVKTEEADEPVMPEALERFRAEMLRHLNYATGHE